MKRTIAPDEPYEPDLFVEIGDEYFNERLQYYEEYAFIMQPVMDCLKPLYEFALKRTSADCYSCCEQLLFEHKCSVEYERVLRAVFQQCTQDFNQFLYRLRILEKEEKRLDAEGYKLDAMHSGIPRHHLGMLDTFLRYSDERMKSELAKIEERNISIREVLL